jgi:transcriptional regulator with XRE-family HTH domain
MRFGESLQRFRENADLSQSGLAEKAGLSVRSIQNWEQGHRVPRADALIALSRALGITVDNLLNGPEPEKNGRKAAGKAQTKKNMQ